jgi:Domain of unknown function (DUF4193)
LRAIVADVEGAGVSIDRRKLDDDTSQETEALEDEDLEDLEDLEDAEDADLHDESAADEEDDEGDDSDADEDSDQASLEELLAQRAAARRGTDDADEDSDIMALSSEGKASSEEPLTTRIAPVRARQEFVCARCHLVKPRVQLADAERGLCRDCA